MQFGRRLLRQQVRGGDSSSYIRIVLLLYATDDWADPKSYHIIREQHGGNLHQKDYCELQAEVLPATA